MAKEIVVPTLGESVTEATVAKWFKAVGDTVTADEPLLELETDKVTLEVPAPASGKLSEIVATDGADVGVGAVLGRIEEDIAATASKQAPAEAAPAPTAPAPPAASPAPTAPAPAAAKADASLAPSVRKLIEENHLDAAAIPATLVPVAGGLVSTATAAAFGGAATPGPAIVAIFLLRTRLSWPHPSPHASFGFLDAQPLALGLLHHLELGIVMCDTKLIERFFFGCFEGLAPNFHPFHGYFFFRSRRRTRGSGSGGFTFFLGVTRFEVDRS